MDTVYLENSNILLNQIKNEFNDIDSFLWIKDFGCNYNYNYGSNENKLKEISEEMFKNYLFLNHEISKSKNLLEIRILLEKEITYINNQMTELDNNNHLRGYFMDILGIYKYFVSRIIKNDMNLIYDINELEIIHKCLDLHHNEKIDKLVTGILHSTNN